MSVTPKGRRRKHPLARLPAILPSFGTGEAAEILGIPVWRLQKFLDSPQYQISPYRRLGRGRGSRRMFSNEDVYRIGIASFLVRDGFAPKFVSIVLQAIEKHDLFGDVDERGHVPPPEGIAFVRGREHPRLEWIRSGGLPDRQRGGAVYYVLDLEKIIDEIDRRLAAFERGKSER